MTAHSTCGYPVCQRFLPDIQTSTTISAKVIEDRVSTAAGRLRADGYEVAVEHLPFRVRWRIRREGSVPKLDTTYGAGGEFNLPRWAEVDFLYNAKGRITEGTVRQTTGADRELGRQIASLIDQLRG